MSKFKKLYLPLLVSAAMNIGNVYAAADDSYTCTVSSSSSPTSTNQEMANALETARVSARGVLNRRPSVMDLQSLGYTGNIKEPEQAREIIAGQKKELETVIKKVSKTFLKETSKTDDSYRNNNNRILISTLMEYNMITYDCNAHTYSLIFDYSDTSKYKGSLKYDFSGHVKKLQNCIKDLLNKCAEQGIDLSGEDDFGSLAIWE